MWHFPLVPLWCRRTDGRTYGHMTTKISRMRRWTIFMVHHCVRMRAPLKNNYYKVIKTLAFVTIDVSWKCPSHLKEYRKKASHVSDFGQWISKNYQVNFQIPQVTFDQVSSLLLDQTNFPWLTPRVHFKSIRPDVTRNVSISFVGRVTLKTGRGRGESRKRTQP